MKEKEREIERERVRAIVEKGRKKNKFNNICNCTF